MFEQEQIEIEVNADRTLCQDRPAGARRPSFAEAYRAAVHELTARYNPDRTDALNTRIETAFGDLYDAGLAFLDACRACETTGLVVRDKATPPRYAYEAVTRLKAAALGTCQRTLVEIIDQREDDKCLALLGCIALGQDIAVMRDSGATRKDAQTIAGSFVRRTIDLIKLYHGGEINACRNPEARLGRAATWAP